MSTQTHLEETLQRDIDQIRRKVAEMGGMGERALKGSLQALVERNRRLAYSVILRDRYIDELETELDRLCLEFLARQQPVAGHLRFVFATLQITRELERVGDYAESVARQVLALEGVEPLPCSATFVELGELAIRILGEALQSYLGRDAELAARTMGVEERSNTLRNRIKTDLLDLSLAGQLPAGALGPLSTIARRLERVADQAKNMCEDVLYMCTGDFVRHKRAETFRILFVDATNRCLSQMAEGLGKALGLPRFVFSSAGLAPQPIDARAVAYMAGKGLDISSQTSKSLAQVPDWEHSQVIVTLGSVNRKALPAHPDKTVCFTWAVEDPSESDAGPENATAGFDAAFASLETHIRELVGAILDEPQPELKL